MQKFCKNEELAIFGIMEYFYGVAHKMTAPEMKSIKKTFIAAFCDHPRQAGETYWQHLLFTIGMAGRLGVCCILLLIHGLLPFTLTHAASARMLKCQRILADRSARTGFDEISGGIGI